MRRISVLLACAVLTACGGGGSGGQQPPSAIQVRRLVVAYGDSTQVGSAPLNRTGPDTPPAAEAQVDLQAAGMDVTVQADGHAGTTAQQMLDGTDNSGLPWDQRLRVLNASIITIKHGINGNATGAEHAATLRLLVQEARAQGRAVLLETPNPVVSGGILSADQIAGVAERVTATRAVAAELGVPLCDHDAAIRAMGWDTLEHMPDGVHPEPAVYGLLGQQMAACLMPMLR